MHAILPPDLENFLKNLHPSWSLESLEMTFYNYLLLLVAFKHQVQHRFCTSERAFFITAALI